MHTNKLERIESLLEEYVGSSKYLVVLNGVVLTHDGSSLYVKLGDSGIVFFTHGRVGNTLIENNVPEIKDRVIKMIGSSVLFGDWDFTEWSDDYFTGRNKLGVRMTTSGAMKVLFIETDMFNVVKNTIMGQRSNNVQFSPTVKGNVLTTQDIIRLRSTFNIKSFINILAIVKLRYLRAARANVRSFYKIDNIFSPMMFRIDGMFNPFYDDAIIKEQLRERKIFQLFEKGFERFENQGMGASFLTDVQVSKGLGLGVLVPFNFEILYNLMVGFVLTKEEAGYRFPNKDKTVYRVVEIREDFPDVFISEEEFKTSSEYKRSFYVPTTTYNKFLLQNYGYFRHHGYSNVNSILDVMRNATLV